jgi:hypothetical protein
VPLAIFASAVLVLGGLKNIGFKGRQIIGLPGAPIRLGPIWSLIKHFLLCFLLDDMGYVPFKGLLNGRRMSEGTYEQIK